MTGESFTPLTPAPLSSSSGSVPAGSSSGIGRGSFSASRMVSSFLPAVVLLERRRARGSSCVVASTVWVYLPGFEDDRRPYFHGSHSAFVCSRHSSRGRGGRKGWVSNFCPTGATRHHLHTCIARDSEGTRIRSQDANMGGLILGVAYIAARFCFVSFRFLFYLHPLRSYRDFPSKSHSKFAYRS